MQTMKRVSLVSSSTDTRAEPVETLARDAAGDLARLTSAIVGSAGEDLLAVDILVNLAAYPGGDGREAQQALLKLHERPGSGVAFIDEQIRGRLLQAARAVCELALVTVPEIVREIGGDRGGEKGGASFDPPLSITVAALASRCPGPPGGRDVTSLARAHIKRQLKRNPPCPLTRKILDEHVPHRT